MILLASMSNHGPTFLLSENTWFLPSAIHVYPFLSIQFNCLALGNKTNYRSCTPTVWKALKPTHSQLVQNINILSDKQQNTARMMVFALLRFSPRTLSTLWFRLVFGSLVYRTSMKSKQTWNTIHTPDWKTVPSKTSGIPLKKKRGRKGKSFCI